MVFSTEISKKSVYQSIPKYFDHPVANNTLVLTSLQELLKKMYLC